MEQLVDTMLRAFETGKMTRWELVRTLGALPAVALPAAGQLATVPSHTPFKGASINHVTIRVSDLKKGTEFYQELLGMRLMARSGGDSNYLALGSSQSFLCVAQADQGRPASIDHFCIGIQNFDADKVMDALKQQKLETPTDETGQVYFLDPDGLRVQLSSTKYNGDGRG
jgi:catechol 2,3-dioxygenase-like lactoylglutathione lyase family enzyme